MNKYNKYLISIFYLSLTIFNSNASEINLELERSAIEEHCEAVFGNFENKLLENNWQILKSNNYTTDYLHLDNSTKITVRKILRGDQINGIRYIFHDGIQNPKLMVNVDKKCIVKLSRLLIKNEKGTIDSIANLSKDLKLVIDQEYFNPPLPEAKPFIGTKVAIVDTGVNYTLKFINSNLSRENNNTLSGYDFEDDDLLPFDIDISRSLFFPFHHGTTVTSIILREAPLSEIVAYRFPRSEMCKFTLLINHIANNKIKIVNLSMGSKHEKDWVCFKNAAYQHKNILFFVSAGNDGINIDEKGVYPASFDLENIIVITSSDIFGNLARDSNFGKNSVDFLIPGEQIPVIDHRGVRSKASGSSYAVPRVVAMAVRYLSKNPNASVGDIKNILISRAVNNNQFVKYGWIPDPLDDYLFD